MARLRVASTITPFSPSPPSVRLRRCAGGAVQPAGLISNEPIRVFPLQPFRIKAMGSLGPGSFRGCRYCEYWVENPYLLEGEPGGSYALCAWCWDLLVENNKQPGGSDHWWSVWRRQTVSAQRFLARWLPDAQLVERVMAFVPCPALPYRYWSQNEALVVAWPRQQLG